MRSQKFRGNVFVTNLPPGCTDEKLASHFDDFGIVLGAFVARDAQSGAPKNHGLVSIAPHAAAAAAIEGLDGSEIDGRRIKVRAADPEMGLTMPTRRERPTYARPAAPDYARRSFVVERIPSRRGRDSGYGGGRP